MAVYDTRSVSDCFMYTGYHPPESPRQRPEPYSIIVDYPARGGWLISNIHEVK